MSKGRGGLLFLSETRIIQRRMTCGLVFGIAERFELSRKAIAGLMYSNANVGIDGRKNSARGIQVTPCALHPCVAW